MFYNSIFLNPRKFKVTLKGTRYFATIALFYLPLSNFARTNACTSVIKTTRPTKCIIVQESKEIKLNKFFSNRRPKYSIDFSCKFIIPLSLHNKHNKIRKSSSLTIREKKDTVTYLKNKLEQNQLDVIEYRDEKEISNNLIQSQQLIEPKKKITSTIFRKIIQTNCLTKIWDTYKSLVEDGNLKYLKSRHINKLMRLIKEFDKDSVSRLEKLQKIHNDIENVGMKETQGVQISLIEAYIDNNMIDKAREVFNKINEWKYIGNGPLKKLDFCNAFNIMIAAYGMRSKPGTNLEEVTKLFTLMHEKNLTPNGTTKTILKDIFRYHLNNDAISWIRELREKNFIDVGFEDMKARNLKPDIYSYVPLIHQLAQHERVDEALKLIEEVKEQKVHLNTVAYNVFIKVYIMASKYEQTDQIIGDMLKQNTEPNTRGKKGARLLFREMQRFGLSPDVYTYTSLINAYVKASDINKAEKIFSEMKKAGIEPSITTYNVLMSYYAKKKDIKKLRQIFNEIVIRNIQPDNFTYCCLMDGFVSNNDFRSAITLLNDMQNRNLKLDAHVYTVLIKAYMKIGNFSKAKSLYETMIKDKVDPTFVTYAVLIDGHARIGELDFSRKLLTELISHGTMNQIAYNKILSPDIFTPLMDAYAKQGLTEPARAIFEEMTTVGAKHNLYVYTILMDAYYRGHNYEAVWQMWKLTKKFFVTPLSKSKIYEQLLDLQQNQQNEHKENSSTMTLAESKWSSSLLISFSLLYSLRPITQSPPNQALSIMINALTAAKKFKLIELEWNKLNNEDFEFDCLNYNDYIQSLIISEKIRLACKLLNEHLVKGWEKGLALSNIYEEKFSTQSIKYRLKNSAKFYPQKKLYSYWPII
ncbi:TPR-like protein [Rhizophagus irregularis]|uniref:TPR-like protein n=1 Tax=Rhizophagus irregularis TaxID=588596 RepID=A0A2N0RSE8_9GLOM|nr:TPR-like protein [Rhizophagus irregularis]